MGSAFILFVVSQFLSRFTGSILCTDVSHLAALTHQNIYHTVKWTRWMAHVRALASSGILQQMLLQYYQTVGFQRKWLTHPLLDVLSGAYIFLSVIPTNHTKYNLYSTTMSQDTKALKFKRLHFHHSFWYGLHQCIMFLCCKGRFGRGNVELVKHIICSDFTACFLRI